MVLNVLAAIAFGYAVCLTGIAGRATCQMVLDYRDGWSADQLDWNMTLKLWAMTIAMTALGAFFLWMR